MDLNELVKGLLSELNKVAKSEAVVGTVRDAGKAKVLPLSKITIGFGTAIGGVGGKAKNETQKSDANVEGGGVGGAVVVEPRAFVVVGEDGVPHMLALRRGKGAVMRRGLEVSPEPELPGGARPRLKAADKK